MTRRSGPLGAILVAALVAGGALAVGVVPVGAAPTTTPGTTTTPAPPLVPPTKPEPDVYWGPTVDEDAPPRLRRRPGSKRSASRPERKPRERRARGRGPRKRKQPPRKQTERAEAPGRCRTEAIIREVPEPPRSKDPKKPFEPAFGGALAKPPGRSETKARRTKSEHPTATRSATRKRPRARRAAHAGDPCAPGRAKPKKRRSPARRPGPTPM
ncbi:MAG: hypothetical protein M3350_05800, partial [Actinomycetota bacterium]|nr:hypothetical protein [Actinomycetota bacterium]